MNPDVNALPKVNTDLVQPVTDKDDDHFPVPGAEPSKEGANTRGYNASEDEVYMRKSSRHREPTKRLT